MTSSKTSTESCDYTSMIKHVNDEKYVIFNTTNDPESKEILDCLRACGLEQFCFRHLSSVYIIESLEFLRQLRETENKELYSFVGGNRINVTNDDLGRIFGLTIGRNYPDEFTVGMSDKEYLQKVLLRQGNITNITNVKVPYMKRKYRLLFEIVSRVILGIAFSPDALTQQKQHVMTAIIKKAPDMNWMGLFKNRLLQETSKLVVNEKNLLGLY